MDLGPAERWEFRGVRLRHRKLLKARHLRPNPQQSRRLNQRPKLPLRSRFDLIVGFVNQNPAWELSQPGFAVSALRNNQRGL